MTAGWDGGFTFMAKDYFIDSRPKRIALTKAQLATPEGRSIVEKLESYAGDGFINLSEAEQLLKWTKEEGSASIRAVSELNLALTEMLSDGKLDTNEESELFRLVKRIVPPDLREDLSQARDLNVEFQEQRKRAKTPTRGSASEAQRDYIKALGGDPNLALSRSEASALIETLLSNQPISNRQRMVLRFWNRLDLASSSKREVSQWMDEHYEADPFHREAWGLFKSETGDSGSQDTTVHVELGVGYKYLSRVKQQNPRNTNFVRPSKTSGGKDMFLFALILAITGLVVGFLFAYAVIDEFRGQVNLFVLNIPEKLGLR